MNAYISWHVGKKLLFLLKLAAFGSAPLTLSSLTFLGYEFRKVRDRLFGTGKRYLHYGLYRLAWADVRRAR